MFINNNNWYMYMNYWNGKINSITCVYSKQGPPFLVCSFQALPVFKISFSRNAGLWPRPLLYLFLYLQNLSFLPESRAGALDPASLSSWYLPLHVEAAGCNFISRFSWSLSTTLFYSPWALGHKGNDLPLECRWGARSNYTHSFDMMFVS